MTTDEEDVLIVEPKKKRKGGFLPGVSGNPNGRKKGSKNKSTLLKEALKNDFEEILQRDFRRVIEVVVEAAIKGDMRAAKMLMDRAVPVHKAIEFKTGESTSGGVNIIIGRMEKPEDIKILKDSKIIELTPDEDE